MTREQIIEILKNPHWFLNGKLFESDFERIADAILALPFDVPSDELIEHLENCLKQPIALIGNIDFQKGYRQSISDLIELINLRWEKGEKRDNKEK